MYRKINLYLGIAAIALFSLAQQQGWNLFSDSANSGKGGSGSSRSYHK